MAHKFPDKRSGALLLVAHRVTNTVVGGQPRRDHASAVSAVLDWAAAEGLGVYQLPLPGYYSQLPQDSSTEYALDLHRDDTARIEFVFSQLDVYRAGGYTIVGAVAVAEDLEDPFEREWWTIFREVAARHGWEDLPIWPSGLDAKNFAPSTPLNRNEITS